MFPPTEHPIVWPAAGDPARFSYVGQISGEADLKAPQSFWSVLGGIIGGPREQQALRTPAAVAVSSADIVYVTDPGLQGVHAFDLESRRYRLLTDAGEGRSFVTPMGIALVGDRPVVADRSLGTLTLLSADGQPEMVLGKDVLVAPVGVAVGPVSRRYYVADVKAHQVQVLDGDGKLVMTMGGRGSGPGEFNFPTYVACDEKENVYVSDSLNFRVQVFDAGGGLLRSWGQRGDRAGDFAQPKGIAVGRTGQVYVVDSRFENAQVFDAEGCLLLAIGEEGTGPGQFWLPSGICVDGTDRVWIADGFNHRVQVFRYIGEEP